jgi:hypothetical protein
MTDTRDPDALRWLAEGLSVVAARIGARDAAAVTAAPAAALVELMKQTWHPDPSETLAMALSAVAGGLGPQDAAQTAAALLQLMKDTRDSYHLSSLARALSAVAARLEPRDAAGIGAPAATILAEAMKDSKRRVGWPQSAQLQRLAEGLAAVAARLEPRDAAAATAQAVALLFQAMDWTRDPLALARLARGLSVVAPRRQGEDEALAAALLLLAIKDPTKVRGDDQELIQGLAALLSAVPPAEIPARSATAASAVGFPAGPGQPLMALAPLVVGAEPPPCRLTTQQLVELLKMPQCVGESRRVVLDQLGNRYRRRFADAWEFVRFAREQNLGLDFTTPPQRPELTAAAKP